jgi:hypothetical protein
MQIEEDKKGQFVVLCCAFDNFFGDQRNGGQKRRLEKVVDDFR